MGKRGGESKTRRLPLFVRMKTYTRKCREKDFTTKETKSKPQILSISNNSKRSKITDYFYKAITDDSQGGEEEEEKVIIKASLEKAAATTTAAAAAACPLKLRQTFLDFGQKNLFMTVCKECGLCYDPSFPQDVKIHKVEHDRYFSCFDSTKVSQGYSIGYNDNNNWYSMKSTLYGGNFYHQEIPFASLMGVTCQAGLLTFWNL